MPTVHPAASHRVAGNSVGNPVGSPKRRRRLGPPKSSGFDRSEAAGELPHLCHAPIGGRGARSREPRPLRDAHDRAALRPSRPVACRPGHPRDHAEARTRRAEPSCLPNDNASAGEKPAGACVGLRRKPVRIRDAGRHPTRRPTGLEHRSPNSMSAVPADIEASQNVADCLAFPVPKSSPIRSRPIACYRVR